MSTTTPQQAAFHDRMSLAMYGEEAPVNSPVTTELLSTVNPTASKPVFGPILMLTHLYNLEVCTPALHKAGDDAWWEAWRASVLDMMVQTALPGTMESAAALVCSFVKHLRIETLQPASAARLPKFLEVCDQVTRAGRATDHLAMLREDGKKSELCMFCAATKGMPVPDGHRSEMSLGALVRFVRDVILAPEARQQKRKRDDDELVEGVEGKRGNERENERENDDSAPAATFRNL